MTTNRQAIAQSLQVVKSLAPMTDTPALAAHDILLILAPPTSLVDYLDRLWAAKTAKGETVPEQWCRWLGRWKRIRSSEPSQIDYVSAEEWQQVGERICN